MNKSFKMRTIQYIFIGLILGLPPASLFAQPGIIQGNGDYISAIKRVQPFERIVLSGPIDLTFENDHSTHNCNSLSVFIDSNLLEFVRVVSKEKTLFVSLPPFAIPSSWARADSDCKNVNFIRTEHNARIRFHIDNDALTLRAENDNGVMNLGGRVKTLSASTINNGVTTTTLLNASEYQISADSDSYLRMLRSDNVNASIAGNGNVLMLDNNQSAYRMKELSQGINVIAPNFYHHDFATAYFNKIDYQKLKPRLIEAAQKTQKEQ